MGGFLIAPAWLIAGGLGTIGIYLLLPRAPRAERARSNVSRRTSAAFGAAALVLFALSAARAGAPVPSVILLAVSVAFAARVVLAPSAGRAAAALSLLLLSDAALLAMHSAWKPAGASVVVCAAAAIGAWLKGVRPNLRQPAFVSDASSHEPFLACIAGGLLFALLAAATQQAGAQEVVGSNSAGLLGAALFAIGIIGFAARREPARSILSWGVIAQGAVMTLSLAGAWMQNGGGERLTLAALAVTSAEAVLALAWIGPRFLRDRAAEGIAAGAVAAEELHG